MIIINLYLTNNNQASNAYLITNRQYQPQYMLTGRLGIKGSGFTLYDIDNRTLGTIIQQNVTLFPTFILKTTANPLKLWDWHWGNYHWGYLTNHWFFYKRGNSYQVYHLHHQVMTINEVITVYGSSLQIQIIKPSDINNCLLLTAVINSWQLPKQHERHLHFLTNHCYTN